MLKKWLKKWFRKFQWRASRWWYKFRCYCGWWYCEECEKMHNPFVDMFDFNNSEFFTCWKAVYKVPIPKCFEANPDFFRKVTLNIKKVW